MAVLPTQTPEQILNDPEALREANLALSTTNIVEDIDEDTLKDMGNKIVGWYDEDLASRDEWERANERWLKLATQVMEQKSFPWRGASNVKYPLLSTAALQFHARAYSALIADERPVKARVLGPDEAPFPKKAIADRISKHMSYQILYEMEDWQEEFDRLLYVLPIVGTVYRKSYYSPIKKSNVSELVLPDDLVINYHAKDFSRAMKTHRIPMTVNEVVEYMRLGYFRDTDLNAPSAKPHKGAEDDITGISMPGRGSEGIPEEGEESEATDVPYEILEAHIWWDTDGDGYQEPWIVTVEYESRKVLRVVARFKYEDIEYDEEGTIQFIRPDENITQYGFLPNPESKIYYQGFGQLLGPLNAAANTIMNQLIDAGTLSNMPGGFLGRGMRMRGGKINMAPGKWEHLPIQGDDIRKNVYPLPYKEPSTVLFQLLGLVLESGEKLSSVRDLMMGDNPGQNQPYATSVMVLEQGLKVFNGIYRRIYRSLSKEYRKLYDLNRTYLVQDKYFALMGEEDASNILVEDYLNSDIDIMPAADPNIVSEAHKVMRANSLLQKVAAGLPLNVQKVTQLVLEAEGHPDTEELMAPNPPQPNPDVEMKKAELRQTAQIEMAKLQVESATKEYEAFKDFAQAMANLAKAEATAAQSEREDIRVLAEGAIDEYKALTERLKAIREINMPNAQAQSQEQESPEKEEMNERPE